MFQETSRAIFIYLVVYSVPQQFRWNQNKNICPYRGEIRAHSSFFSNASTVFCQHVVPPTRFMVGSIAEQCKESIICFLHERRHQHFRNTIGIRGNAQFGQRCLLRSDLDLANETFKQSSLTAPEKSPIYCSWKAIAFVVSDWHLGMFTTLSFWWHISSLNPPAEKPFELQKP